MSHLVLVEGAVFASRYRVVRCIAQGGMGAVYEVVHIETNKHRALKVMLPNMLEAKGMHERFQQEARVTSGIESEFIVEVMDAGIDEATRTPFLVMELLRGEDLNRKIKREGRLDAVEVLTLLRQAAMALDKTHKASIVHRDLKPENLFLTERDDGSPRIKILDFGVAKLVADTATSAHATQSLGTPLYMAPEQFSHGGSISALSDVYALGLIAYTLLVGVTYWQDEIDAGTNIYMFVGVAARGLRESPVARAARRGVALPPAFDEWCFKASALKQADRFGSASEAVNALGEVFGVLYGLPSNSGPASLASIGATTGSSPLRSSTPSFPLSASGSAAAQVPASQSWDPSKALPKPDDISALGSGGQPAPEEGNGLSVMRGSTGAGIASTARASGTKLPIRGIWAAVAILGAAVAGIVWAHFFMAPPDTASEAVNAELKISGAAEPVPSAQAAASASAEPVPSAQAAASASAEPKVLPEDGGAGQEEDGGVIDIDAPDAGSPAPPALPSGSTETAGAASAMPDDKTSKPTAAPLLSGPKPPPSTAKTAKPKPSASDPYRDYK